MVYATRIPERWKPGAFDLMFHSHQLFHIAVIVAALVRPLLMHSQHIHTAAWCYDNTRLKCIAGSFPQKHPVWPLSNA